MASLPPSSTMVQMTSQTNDRAPPTMPKGADDSSVTITMAADRTVADKVMSSAANLAQLLPTGTVMAYQALSPSFTNHGTCYPADKWLTATLVTLLTTFSFLFSFTDSIIGRDSKLYYGVATPHGFNVFNFSGEEEEREWALSELQKLRLRPLDYVHAVVTAVVFLTLAFSDADLQRCFFPHASNNTSQLLKNLPLGMAFVSSFVYMIFPTKRKGIGHSDTTPRKKA